MPSSVNKPAEHPAKAIMAKRWEERRAEAHARRPVELNLGDSGVITLAAFAGATGPAADSGSHALVPAAEASASFAAKSKTPTGAPAAKASPAVIAESVASAAVPATEATHAEAADISAVAPVPKAGVARDAIAYSSTTASWLRDSRKAMLVVALASLSLLLALLYLGGFLS